VTLYCGSRDCSKSTQAARQLELAGFSGVQVYEEGARGWKDQTQQAAMNVGS
jgi:rhodanese-related sulfurtransferase